MSRILFSTGTARGGTNLVAKMLNVLPQACVASDPFLPLFKSFRSAVLKDKLGLDVSPEAPLADHYYDEGGPEALRALYEGELNTAFAPAGRPALLESLAKRMRLSAENLVEHLDKLEGRSYLDLFRRGLDIIPEAHGKRPQVHGFNDNWAIEFFPALARAFPDARFLVMVRDPRAAICSALRQQDPSRIAPVLSFSRGWRKNVAYLERFKRDPLFGPRLLALTYEDLVRDPRRRISELCAWLELPFDEAMLDPRRYVDGGGRPWTPNTHVHDAAPTGIFQDSIDAWRKKLAPAAAECIELVCGSEMPGYGYAAASYEGGLLSPAAMSFLLDNDRAPASWRGGGAGVEDEVRCEMFRRQLLACPDARLQPSMVERYFLFPEARAPRPGILTEAGTR